ncbi:hypothetical protein MSAN_00229100 [Mycena sanguinolenta]|uniref:F-box domain-containing protein n=1 Tax=Mycena sanguinolenta TaxID=230812 RepID=A0A8H6ZKH0_9AGAR|nr:hypothetical protein MSAN_00229100 [Mycena sanguinolenta]
MNGIPGKKKENIYGRNSISIPRGAQRRIPIEIWLEVVSDSTFLTLGSAKDGIPRSLLLLNRSKIESCPKTIPPAYRERPETLRALSQTCRTFREISLPLYWEHVEACFVSRSSEPWSTRVALVLLDRCKGLLRPESQHLALHVRVFSVSLSSHHIATAVSSFAKCLASLPNLDTLHILYLQSQWERNVTAAFKTVKLPAVKTIILPSHAHGILRACPNVRDVSCNEEVGEQLLDTLIQHCPKVKRIQDFEVTNEVLDELSQGLPKLREIAVPANSDLSSLSVLRNLSVIELIAKRWEYVDESLIDSEDLSAGTAYKKKLINTNQQRTEAARAILKASTGRAPKSIKMSYWEDITGMVGMMQFTYGQYWVKADEFEVLARIAFYNEGQSKEKDEPRKLRQSKHRPWRTPPAALRVPSEIWLDVVSDYNFLALDSTKDGIPRSLLLLNRNIKGSPKALPPVYHTRSETLRALSQMCRSFRETFLPLLWEHVEACFLSASNEKWSTRVARVLLDRCKGLLKRENRHLALHVRVFTVSISSDRIGTVVPLFAKCLASLPNLTTLNIMYLQSKWERNVTAEFKNIQLPTIQTVILPSHTHGILRSCPNVRDVSCNEEVGEKLLATLIQHCPKVERIQGFEIADEVLEELSEGLPNLREIAVPADIDISSLSVLNNLSVIELMANQEEDPDDCEYADVDLEDLAELKRQRIEAARAVLRASSGKAPKRIKLSYWEDITGMLGMMEITYGQYWVGAEEIEV